TPSTRSPAGDSHWSSPRAQNENRRPDNKSSLRPRKRSSSSSRARSTPEKSTESAVLDAPLVAGERVVAARRRDDDAAELLHGPEAVQLVSVGIGVDHDRCEAVDMVARRVGTQLRQRRTDGRGEERALERREGADVDEGRRR